MYCRLEKNTYLCPLLQSPLEEDSAKMLSVRSVFAAFQGG